MAGDYKLFASIVIFLVIVLGSLTLASQSGVKGVTPTAPSGSTWPPTFPQFSNPLGSWAVIPSNCDTGVFDALKCIAIGFLAFVGILVGGIVWVAASVWWVMSFFYGILTFRLPNAGGNPVIGMVNDILWIGLGLVLVLVIIRFARSIVPWVSGE